MTHELPPQDDAVAARITCSALRRAEIRDQLDSLLLITAANAEAGRLSLRICDDRGARYHFNEVWSAVGEADRAFAELRGLPGKDAAR